MALDIWECVYEKYNKIERNGNKCTCYERLNFNDVSSLSPSLPYNPSTFPFCCRNKSNNSIIHAWSSDKFLLTIYFLFFLVGQDLGELICEAELFIEVLLFEFLIFDNFMFLSMEIISSRIGGLNVSRKY